MKTKFTLKYMAVLLLIVAGYLSACTSMELDSQEFGNEVIETRAMEFVGTSRFYYYYGNERQYLQLNTRYMFVSMADESTVSMLASISSARHQPVSVDIPNEVQSISDRTITARQRFYTTLSFDEAMSEREYLAKLSEISNLVEGVIVAPYFKNKYNDRIGLSNFFYVKLRDLNDIELLEQKAEKKQAIIVHQNEFMPLWWVLSVTENSNYNAMEMANHFHRSRLFQFAEPDFIVEDEFLCANDEHFGLQWGLRNTIQFGGRSIDINICNAWQISTGQGVVVAVFDNGINLLHPDLRFNIHHISFDSESGTLPQRVLGVGVFRDHGTAVAGVIGAKRNNIGIAGVAPNSRIMSVSNSLAGTVLSRERRANGINWAWQHGADIINNSWGSATRHQILDDAINNAVQNGRNGRGSVVIFASGNGGNSSVSYPASLPNVIAVGAINRNGQRATFSQFGSALDIVAPGEGIWTTAYSGYMVDSGTSLAAPHVAGVAALMLSVNPTLRGEEVRNIIERTANRNLPGFTTTQNRANGTWNDRLGHGLVDAYAAVREAIGGRPTVTGPLNICSVGATGTFTIQNVPPGATVRWIADIPLSILYTTPSTVTVVNTPVFTINSRIRAEIIVNGQVIQTLQHNVMTGRPVIHSMDVPNSIRPNVPALFTVSQSGGATTWNTSGGTLNPTTGFNRQYITFPSVGNFTITATVGNACGAVTMSRDVTVTGISPHSVVRCLLEDSP